MICRKHQIAHAAPIIPPAVTRPKWWQSVVTAMVAWITHFTISTRAASVGSNLGVTPRAYR
jgi:hypothetical protein